MDTKEEGNKKVKEGKLDDAIEVYLRSLCAFEFDPKSTKPEDLKAVNFDLKAPILNNLALCLMKQKRFAAALKMLD
eukprot:CAMPEP_0202972198 /NCGR_PEP_ID=MMETSP1396-20130829/34246_1 /ASSEMBLY_ACC=CAM_ASM_000872 /TAXON_ID= /ORGANISM="Pseudokeronopsis sp., Strain Brazil" /LENGTH=75 /DNA_ID=CAMNT_0049702341 /DNA_START=196 /DNA_END=423 /DNA_ORIENTATION=-